MNYVKKVIENFKNTSVPKIKKNISVHKNRSNYVHNRKTLDKYLATSKKEKTFLFQNEKTAKTILYLKVRAAFQTEEGGNLGKGPNSGERGHQKSPKFQLGKVQN